jgi:hypothetical protein
MIRFPHQRVGVVRRKGKKRKREQMPERNRKTETAPRPLGMPVQFPTVPGAIRNRPNPNTVGIAMTGEARTVGSRSRLWGASSNGPLLPLAQITRGKCVEGFSQYAHDFVCGRRIQGHGRLNTKVVRVGHG